MTAWVILTVIVVANAIGAFLFIADKRAAEADVQRVPERTLLTLAALGAAPLMLWLASKIRHKTQKQPFRSILIAIAAVQAGLLIAAPFV